MLTDVLIPIVSSLSFVFPPFRSKIKNVQDFMVDLVTCKNEKDTMKNEDTIVVTTFSIYGVGNFFAQDK